MSALDTQVGGNHYRNGGIQPVEYIESNKLQFLEASVVKRMTRHDKPGGKGRQDIEKAIHELQLLLELRYPLQGLAGVLSRPVDLSKLTPEQVHWAIEKGAEMYGAGATSNGSSE